MAAVTETDLEAYERLGYVVLRDLLAAEDLASTRDVLEQMADQRINTLLAEGKISSAYRDESFVHRTARAYNEAELTPVLWDLTRELRAPDLLPIVGHPALLDAVESLMGSEVAWTGSYATRPKVPHQPGRVPEPSAVSAWHQDSQFYGAETSALCVVTVWIPLVDVDKSNGCLAVIPGSHEWGLLDGERDEHRVFRSYEDVEKRGTPVLIPMHVGDVLLFSNLTFHGSGRNTTNAVRWSIDLRYAEPAGRRQLTVEQEAGYETLYSNYGTEPITLRSAEPGRVATPEQFGEFVDRRNMPKRSKQPQPSPG